MNFNKQKNQETKTTKNWKHFNLIDEPIIKVIYEPVQHESWGGENIFYRNENTNKTRKRSKTAN